MKLCSIGFAACLVLSQCFLYHCERLQCIKELNSLQVETLQHFNGIFGSFKATSKLDDTAVYGPMIASNVSSSGYGFNTILQKSNCETSNHVLRYGLLAKEADIQGDTFGEIWAENSTIDTRNTRNISCSSREQETQKDLFDSIWSFIPKAVTEASHKLASFQPDTVISLYTGIVASKTSSVLGYNFLKLPACSDKKCSPTEKHETDPRFLKGNETWKVNHQAITTFVFNIPVYVGSTFTISRLDVNKNISICHAIFNFYPVDQAGKLVTDPNAYFTLVRSPDVVIAGTILAPQARIMDSKTGYFGGQLISLQSYTGSGASIRGFDTLSDRKCSFHKHCWPLIPDATTNAVDKVALISGSRSVNQSEISTQKSSIKGLHAHPNVTSTILDATETIHLEANIGHHSHENEGIRPVNFLDINDALADVVDDFATQTFTTTRYTNTVDELHMLVVTETRVDSATRTHYEQETSTTTLDQTVIDFGLATSFSVRLFRSTLPVSYSTVSRVGLSATWSGISITTSTDDAEQTGWWDHHKHKHKNKHYHHKHKGKDDDVDDDDDDDDDEECDED